MPHNLPARPRTPPESDTTGTAVTATAPRMILNRYELLEPLGAGGMGQVFVARDRSLRRDVAIKVLAANLAARPGFSQQLLREARAVAQLHHPHIATVYERGRRRWLGVHRDGVPARRNARKPASARAALNRRGNSSWMRRSREP